MPSPSNSLDWHTRSGGNCLAVRPTWDPLVRAARSIPLNIAEGVCRDGGDVLRHLLIARGSAGECAAILDILAVHDLDEEESIVRGRNNLRRIGQMITGFRRRLLRLAR